MPFPGGQRKYHFTEDFQRHQLDEVDCFKPVKERPLSPVRIKIVLKYMMLIKITTSGSKMPWNQSRNLSSCSTSPHIILVNKRPPHTFVPLRNMRFILVSVSEPQTFCRVYEPISPAKGLQRNSCYSGRNLGFFWKLETRNLQKLHL